MRMMFRISCLSVLLIGMTPLFAQSTATESATVLQQEANLRQVQMIGPRHAYAVGDYGVICKTIDGGETWKWCSPLHAPETPAQQKQWEQKLPHWKVVSTFSDQHVWVAGGRLERQPLMARGMALQSADGGTTWQVLNLPVCGMVRVIQRFDLQTALLLADPTRETPSGLFLTQDGGKTWQLIPGDAYEPWQTAAFTDLEHGVLVSQSGHYYTFDGSKILRDSQRDFRVKMPRQIRFDFQGQGLIAGDGHLLLKSASGGSFWEAERKADAQRTFENWSDLNAIAQRDQFAWVAGSPGKVVWKNDATTGEWSSHSCPLPGAIGSLDFGSSSQGIAVGEFGGIAITQDGGLHWKKVQGPSVRLAIWDVQPRREELGRAVSSYHGAEQEFRIGHCVLTKPVQEQVKPSSHDQTQAMSQHLLGSIAREYWMLEDQLPGTRQNLPLLLEHWKASTEQKMAPWLVGRLVRDIRQYQPEVILIPEARPNDAMSRLLHAAVSTALTEAADRTYWPELTSLGLQPWQVPRVFSREAELQVGKVKIDAQQPLLSFGVSAGQLQQQAKQYFDLKPETALPARYQLRLLNGQTPSVQPTWTSLMMGIVEPSGLPIQRNRRVGEDEQQLAILQKQLRHQNYITQAFRRQTLQQQSSAAMVAQLDSAFAPLTPTQRAEVLSQWILSLQQTGDWETLEAVLIEQTQRNTDQLPAIAAALLQLWTSDEIAFQRLKPLEKGKTVVSANRDQIFGSIVRAGHVEPQTQPQRIQTSVDVAMNENAANDLKMRRANWTDQAYQMTEQLLDRSPALLSNPEIQQSVQVVLRRVNQQNKATLLNRLRSSLGPVPGVPWGTETIRKTVRVLRTDARPTLDCELGEACWEQAETIELIPAQWNAAYSTTSADHAKVWLCYDENCLYLSAYCPFVEGQTAPFTQLTERKYDEANRQLDHLSLKLDLDSDALSSYQFTLDHQGRTADSCCQVEAWNPEWYVKTEQERNGWRVEMAIPFASLSFRKAQSGDQWGLALERVLPALGRQVVEGPHSAAVSVNGFVTLQFE